MSEMRSYGNITTKHRIIVKLYDRDGYTFAKIGKMLGITGNAVRLQYHRAKQKIQFNEIAPQQGKTKKQKENNANLQ